MSGPAEGRTHSLACTHVAALCGLCTFRLDDVLSTLPEDGATKSRDYGRGYAQAIRDVRALIAPASTSTSEQAD